MSEPDNARPPSLPANNAPRRRSSIGLTPLIDVVFILIVFFMLASSFFDWRAVELDAPVKASGGAAMEGAMLIELRPGGIRLSGENTTLDEVSRRIEKRLQSEPDQRVLIKPAAGISVQDVLRVVDRLAIAGVRNMSFAGDPVP